MTTWLERFETREIQPEDFDHESHIEVAIDLLRTTTFFDAVMRYLEGLRGMAQAAGTPEKVNVTITIAFLSLIAERLETVPDSFRAAQLLARYPELTSTRTLERWYSSARLHSELARSAFLLLELDGPRIDALERD